MINILRPDYNDIANLPPNKEDPHAEPLENTPDQLRQHLYDLSTVWWLQYYLDCVQRVQR